MDLVGKLEKKVVYDIASCPIGSLKNKKKARICSSME